jgi:hypothetical protein
VKADGGLNLCDGLLELTYEGRTVNVMVFIVCWNKLHGGRTLDVMVLMVCWS